MRLFDEDGLFADERGLWAMVLLNILHDLRGPPYSREYRDALRIVNRPESGCLPIIAEALRIEIGDLQKRIIQKIA